MNPFSVLAPCRSIVLVSIDQDVSLRALREVSELLSNVVDGVFENASTTFEYISALNQLEEAGQDLTTLHLLDVPITLHRNLLSTNIIENSIRTVRGTIGRVKRWRPETDQPRRWLALALTEIERAFQRPLSRLPGERCCF